MALPLKSVYITFSLFSSSSSFVGPGARPPYSIPATIDLPTLKTLHHRSAVRSNLSTLTEVFTSKYKKNLHRDGLRN